MVLRRVRSSTTVLSGPPAWTARKLDPLERGHAAAGPDARTLESPAIVLALCAGRRRLSGSPANLPPPGERAPVRGGSAEGGGSYNGTGAATATTSQTNSIGGGARSSAGLPIHAPVPAVAGVFIKTSGRILARCIVLAALGSQLSNGLR